MLSMKPFVFSALTLVALASTSAAAKTPRVEVEVLATASTYVLSPMYGDVCEQRLPPRGLNRGGYKAIYVFRTASDGAGKLLSATTPKELATEDAPVCKFAKTPTPRDVQVVWDVTVITQE